MDIIKYLTTCLNINKTELKGLLKVWDTNNVEYKLNVLNAILVKSEIEYPNVSLTFDKTGSNIRFFGQIKKIDPLTFEFVNPLKFNYKVSCLSNVLEAFKVEREFKQFDKGTHKTIFTGHVNRIPNYKVVKIV